MIHLVVAGILVNASCGLGLIQNKRRSVFVDGGRRTELDGSFLRFEYTLLIHYPLANYRCSAYADLA